MVAQIDVVRSLEDAASQWVTWWNRPSGDPFVQDVLLTPGPGHARWLSQRLALAHGVAAGFTISTWSRLRADTERELLGIDRRCDPWSTTGVASALLQVFDTCWGQPWMARLREHLEPTVLPGESSERPGRRLATATRLARLLLSYGQRVPIMVQAWDEGRPVGPSAAGERELDLTDAAWQYQLWRALTAHITGRSPSAPPAPLPRHAMLVEALRARGEAPRRLAAVQIEPLAPLDAELLHAWGDGASTRLWQVVAPDPSRRGPLARLARAQSSALAAVGGAAALPPLSGHAPSTSLGRLQALLQGRPFVAGPADASVQLHASHGPDRQVEVVREVLCGLFDDHPDLEPRDVVILCPDLARYAALIDSAFGLGELGHHPGHQLRVQTPGLRTVENQALALLERVLALPSERATSADLLDLCANPCVATRFGFDGAERDRLHELVTRSEIRWGLDQAHRQDAFELRHGASTWFGGVERLLLGAAMSDSPPTSVGLTAAVERIDSQDLVVAGSLAELVSRLRKLRRDTDEPATAQAWVDRLDHVLDLVAALPWEQRWQITAARAAVRSWADRSGGQGLLSRADVRTVIHDVAERVQRRPSFGNGNLHVVGLDDLRGLPHRVVVLLGLDDSSFPARSQRLGDDLVPAALQPPWADPRSRSHAGLLDAILAATGTLVVTYAHHDPRTNEEVDEPVVVTELRDALTSVTSRGDTTPRARWAVRRHTLQPHSQQNFVTSTGDVPFSFDSHSHAGAAALLVRLEDPPAHAPDPVTWRFPRPDENEPLSLVDLVAFWAHPARALLQHVVGTTMKRWDTELATELPLELHGLGEFRVGEGLLASHAAGLSREEALHLEWLRGSVPPGKLGERTLKPVMSGVDRLIGQAEAFGGEVVDLPVTLTVGRRLVTGVVRLRGGRVVDRAYSNLKGSALVSSWLHLLAATAATGDSSLEAVLVRKDGTVRLSAPSPVEAATALGWFVRWHSVGLGRILLAPPDLLFLDCQVQGVWGTQRDPADVERRWQQTMRGDDDWAVFTSDPWEVLRQRPSGVEGMSVATLAAHLFGRIAEARTR